MERSEIRGWPRESCDAGLRSAPSGLQRLPRRMSMQGKVVVVTGASGALGKVVAQAALARGARVASVDYARSDIAGTSDHMELGGVDLSDAAQAGKTIEAVAAHF